jgi:ribosomal RNA assembly protein
VDKLLATGEYFLKEDQRKQRKKNENQEKQEQAEVRRKERRESAFIPPQEPSTSSGAKDSTSDINVEELKNKIRKGQAKRKHM